MRNACCQEQNGNNLNDSVNFYMRKDDQFLHTKPSSYLYSVDEMTHPCYPNGMYGRDKQPCQAKLSNFRVI